jgi:uncharacterized membrane protein (UPF0182 family)
MAVWALVAVAGAGLYPASVQRLQVQPNELEKERSYIERNIEMTRRAFGLDQIEEEAYPAAAAVTAAEIQANPETINNLRLLDVEPLRETYAQIQTIRPLYEFLDVDIDRYIIDGVKRQVMISARELSPSRLPENTQSWVNRRLQFTHGHGAVMSPVNEVVEEGLPTLFLKDIPVTGKVQVSEPDIYFGEQEDHYVIVKTNAREFDRPEGTGSVQSVFEGEGGVPIGSRLKRLVFAWEFRDLNIAISGSLTGESAILFRRNIQERVHTLAPFLELDHDPYLVIDQGRMYWIQDAYTTTTRYPYSQPWNNGLNYIRNSVKVVINAYDGATTFYITDDSDPIIRSYASMFPKLFRSLDEMPDSLRAHIRYPEDMFLAQAQQYRTYHITNADGLYHQEDLWSIPTENFTGVNRTVEPYYVTLRIPGESREEFALILPMTPARRANTIAWLAARSDGENYGKIITFRFPSDSLVFGPQQVESRIDQDPNISAQFSLWNQSGSRVIRGNLLMIPIGNGNLFVEPIYLQSETSRLPELKRVVVANGNNIAMEPSLQRALQVIFGQAPPTPPNTADVGGSPTPPAGAAPTPTPLPGSTPAPAATPGSLADLSAQANQAYLAAQEALRRGDFATYGQQIERVGQLLQQIAQLSGR